MNDTYRQGPTLLESMWRYRLVIVVVPLLCGLLGYFVAIQQTPIYDAGARLFLADPAQTPGIDDTSRNRVDPVEFVPQQAARVASRAVFEAASDMLSGGPSVRELIDTVAIEETPEDLSLTIRASDPDPEVAADIANAMAASFMQLNEAEQQEAAERALFELNQLTVDLDTRLAELESQLDDSGENLAIQNQIQNLSLRLIDLDRLSSTVRIEADLRGNGVSVFEEALAPAAPARPQVRLQTALFVFLGGVLASLWAYWIAPRSQRVLGKADPESLLGVPLLGEIPQYRGGNDSLNGLINPDPMVAEAYEFVLSSIEFALADTGGKSVLVTSALPGDGKTTTTLQLVVAASRNERRVLLIDADIRAHGLTRVLGAEDRNGLSDLVVLDLEPVDIVRRYRFNEHVQVPIITAGQHRADPAALLRSGAFQRTMAKLADTADMVVIDTSPLLAVADATIAAAAADAIVIVVNRGTLVSDLQRVRERLNFVSTPLIGYVYNRAVDTSAGAYGYGYGTADTGRGRTLFSRANRVRGLRAAKRAEDVDHVA